MIGRELVVGGRQSTVAALLAGIAVACASPAPTVTERATPTPSATPSPLATPTDPAPTDDESAALERALTVVIGGDCSFGRGVAARATEAGWSGLFGAASDILRSADLAIVNLESPLAPCLSGGTATRPRLCAEAAAVAALRAAGVDAVTIANNHALDGGRDGLRATARRLAEPGIISLGSGGLTGGPLTAEPLGAIAVVAANLTVPALPPQSELPLASPAELAAAITAARDHDPDRPVLAILHLGRELDSAAGPRERRYARAAIEAGAAAVILHGAHVMRRLLFDHGVPVHLGLGNLVFDQHDPRTRRGALLTLRLAPGRSAEVVGVTCVDSLTGDLMDCD